MRTIVRCSFPKVDAIIAGIVGMSNCRSQMADSTTISHRLFAISHSRLRLELPVAHAHANFFAPRDLHMALDHASALFLAHNRVTAREGCLRIQCGELK